MKYKIVFILLSALSATCAIATPTQSHARQTASRIKTLDLEGAVVESMSKRPLDSMTEVLDEGGNKKGKHLYSKPSNFQPENRSTLERARSRL